MLRNNNLTLDPKYNRTVVERLRTAVVGCNLNHVPQAVRRVLETGAWRERWEVNLHWKFERFRDFIIASPVDGGMGFKPELVEGLLEKADNPEVLKLWHAAMRADEVHELNSTTPDLKDVGHPSSNPDTKQNDIRIETQYGTSDEYAIAKLRKEAATNARVADIHQRVLAGELSPNAGMVEAGFRKKRPSRKLTPFERFRRLWAKASEHERSAIREWIANA